jgi:IclR family acetate operon transcriptional repressor
MRLTGGSTYALTVKLAALGLSYMANNGISDAIQPLFEELAQETRELVRLAIIEDTRLICVAKAQGAKTGLRYDPDTSAEANLPASANGLARMEAVSEERALELIATQRMQRAATMGPGAPRTLREVLELRKLTRRQG